MDSSIRILLIDENTVVRDALRALINTAPDMAVVGDAADGTEGEKLALLLQPNVIILDLSTPGSNGARLIDSLIKASPRLRILVLTDELKKEEILAAIDAGASGYLLKGTTAPQILQAIRRLHRGESIFYPMITRMP